MKIQHLKAVVFLGLATVPGSRAAVRRFKAGTLGPLALASLLVAGPAKRRVFEIACLAPRDDLPVSHLLHHAERPVHVWLSES